MGRSLRFLACESAQQVLKLRQRIRVVLDLTCSDRITLHRRGLLGCVAKDSYLKFHIPKEAPSSIFSRCHLSKSLFPSCSASF